ncbi:MAG TPA: MBL fold metallo-hydrolase [Candidatus Barnesiella excrementigallinarum]|nr:MBL fold metallo-hydrolase [Candidatus Barnesiella excrementigallinarum]
MKTGIFLLTGALAVSLLGTIGCNNAQKQTTAQDESPAIFVCTDSTTIEYNGCKLTWIRDNAQEHRMPLSLFGELSQKLVDSLSINNGIASSMSAFLLETDGKRILFDTGMGSPESQLETGLAAAGISPADIDYIYITHFHGDHIGGLMKEGSAVFPKAEVYAARQEYEGWMQMPDEQKAQVVATMNAYKDRLHLIEYNDTLPGGVIALNGEGHTPGHTIYQAAPFLIVGDLVHGAALQLAHPEICASYDMDPQKAAATRKQFLEYARQNNLFMAGMHQPEKSAE